MKTSFLSENLGKKIALVNHAVSSRSQLPVLLNFLLVSKKGKLFISATDLEVGIEVSIPANVEEEGGVTVPAKTFFDLLTNIPKGKITLHTEDQRLILKSERIRTVFQTIPQEEFPKIYEEKGEKRAVVERKTIEKDFAKVVFAASQDSGRPALSGVLMKKEEGKGGRFVLVATDGYRLSLKRGVGGGVSSTTKEDGLVMPARIIRELVSVREGESVEIFVSEKSNQILFFQDETVLAVRLIEAEFPSYEKIIPTDFSTRVVVGKNEIQSAVKACSVFAREAASIIKFSVGKDKLVVSASAPSLGESTIDVDAVVEGEENEIAFNSRYLLDFFSNMEEEEVVFEMTGPLNPGVFKIKGDDTFLHIIMPIRVQE
ncbi:DNA polymerase III subunit beta [Patescibacteria group bacterium]|nr:DNA polymerase III subunit beta [Patescibacteria group bacterium]